MTDTQKRIYQICADTLDEVAKLSKFITSSNVEHVCKQITSICETEMLAINGARDIEEKEAGLYSNLEDVFSSIKHSSEELPKLHLGEQLIKSYSYKLRSYARTKATIIRDTILIENCYEEDSEF